MLKYSEANFSPCQNVVTASAVWQWDYGQKLRISGLDLPLAVEVNFSLSESMGTTETRVGVTADGVTEVLIPDVYLENPLTAYNYNIFAFIFLTDEDAGETEYKIVIPVNVRPEHTEETSTDSGLTLDEAVTAVNKAAEDAEGFSKLSESWAVGGTGIRDGEDFNNSKFFAKLAEQSAEGKGFVWFEITYPGDLIMTRTDNLEDDLDFEITEDGDLEVIFA